MPVHSMAELPALKSQQITHADDTDAIPAERQQQQVPDG
jgi:hypothetical protein